MNTEMLKKIMTVQGVSGGEGAVAARIADMIAPYVDECRTDNMGNLIAVKKGEADHKKVMLCAHMDEIGFIVTAIEDSGLVRFAGIGGINYVASGYTVVVSSKGVKGVLVPEAGTKAADLAFDKCYIDIGAKDKKDAERRVSVGDYFAVEPDITRLNSTRLVGRPMDDRVGCAALVMIAEQLANGGCDHDMYYVFSVQEEVGCRGAKPASFAIAPDLALVYDVTSTGDVPGARPMAVKLGGGAAIKIKDASVICHAATVSELIDTAKANKIKYQCEVLTAGGTDTSSIQMNGVGCRAAAISIPTRYIHSNVEMIDTADLEATVALSVAYLKGLK